MTIHVVIGWQQSKQCVRWPVLPERIVGSGINPLSSSIFEIIRWQLTTFQMIAGSSSFFFKCMWNTLCSWVAPLKFWFQNDLGRKNSAEFCMQSLFTSLTMVTSWSRSSSNFYTLIGQNFAGEFMRKMYAASGTCFLIAEADRVLCRQLVVFLTAFFQWIYKMNTAGIKILL